MYNATRYIAGVLIAVFALLLAGDAAAATICVVRQGVAMGTKCSSQGISSCSCKAARMKKESAESHACPFRKLLYTPASSSVQTTVQQHTDVTPPPVELYLPVLYDASADVAFSSQAPTPPDIVILHRNLRI